MPWYEYMKTGMGLMQIAPSEFWQMTPIEFWAIYNARFTKPKTQGMSRKEFEGYLKRIK
jgi:uncharacterized phage protein (TIGR02216 family)